MSDLDLDAALAASIEQVRTVRAEQAEREQAAPPKRPRTPPPIDKGDVTFDGYSTTTRICALCDSGIHVGTPVVRHWPATASHVNDAYHPSCWKERTHA